MAEVHEVPLDDALNVAVKLGAAGTAGQMP